jgi:hypothetical protein
MTGCGCGGLSPPLENPLMMGGSNKKKGGRPKPKPKPKPNTGKKNTRKK